MKVTPKQLKLLQFITKFQEKKGYAPSQKEIAEHFGFSSLGTVQNYLKRLEAQGHLSKSWNGKRDLKVRDIKSVPAPQPQFQPAHEGVPSLSFPLVGRVAAGHPIEAIDQNKNLNILDLVFRGDPQKDDVVALKVQGDSMKDEGILDGDYVLIRRLKGAAARNGDVVVALWNNEATLKRYYLKGSRIELHPANGNYKPILISAEEAEAGDFRVEGILTAVIRSVG